MDFIKALKTSLSGNNVNKKVFSALAVILAILALFLVGTVLFPAVVSAIFNILWIVLIAVVIVFFVLGILVILGMRKEVSQFLDILLEGSLTIIDFLHFLRDLWKRFIALLKEFLVYAAPVFSYIFTFIIYIVLMYIYKTIGSHSDVTLLTVILTLTLIIAFGIVNKPKINQTEPVDWKDFFKQRFRRGFIDGSEVLLFVFFLTMDSTKLLFLPARLNIPIKAALAGNDLMVKGFVFQNNFKFTLTLIVVSISIEILRNVLRVVVSAEENYRLLFLENMQKAEKSRLITLVKLAVRRSFNDAKDDLMRFITFTTILFIAFLFFPRLKLLTLVVASVGNLTLDMFIRSRLMNQKSDDLISRCLDKLFFRDKAKSVNTQLMQTAPTQDPEVN